MIAATSATVRKRTSDRLDIGTLPARVVVAGFPTGDARNARALRRGSGHAGLGVSPVWSSAFRFGHVGEDRPKSRYDGICVHQHRNTVPAAAERHRTARHPL